MKRSFEAFFKAKEAGDSRLHLLEESGALDGFALGATSPREIELGEAIRAAMPSMEKMRFTSSGTEATLKPHAGRYDVVFVITDGLSARAVQTHAQPVLAQAVPALSADRWRIAPFVIVHHGRVAIGDAIAAALGADSVVVLIGERPGLSAPDSMGAYLTWQPHPQTTDADRNCISNIRPEGIGYADAAFRLVHLLRAMRKRGMSGVALKDESDRLLIGS